jgi:hypothetical protein
MEPELPWEMIRTDWVQLLVWEVAHPDGLPVIVSSKLLSLSNLTAAGKICVWNYFWACRMAYAHMVADDYVAIKFDTQQWITSLNLEGIEAFVSFP